MEETLASLKILEIDLINYLAIISSNIFCRIVKLEGHVPKNHKEKIIFIGFSSSKTHPIKIDLEKNFRNWI